MGSVPVAMPAEAAVLPAPPGYRTVDDEKADYTEALKRVNGQAFKDWPNEAGVCFTLHDHTNRLCVLLANKTV